jgi:hypothetical protein
MAQQPVRADQVDPRHRQVARQESRRAVVVHQDAGPLDENDPAFRASVRHTEVTLRWRAMACSCAPSITFIASGKGDRMTGYFW